MKATLLVGDYLFVSKYSYGYSQLSRSRSRRRCSPAASWASSPKRGDVVVFQLPRDNSTDYIKRVIGLPGDRIQMIDGVLHINGEPVKRERVDGLRRDRGRRPHAPRAALDARRCRTACSYDDARSATTNGFCDNTQVYIVPAGHYFMMGDNRDNSTDSRVLSQVGYVPFENLVGRAEIIFFSVDEGERAWQFWRWPWTVRWGRLFTIVR